MYTVEPDRPRLPVCFDTRRLWIHWISNKIHEKMHKIRFKKRCYYTLTKGVNQLNELLVFAVCKNVKNLVACGNWTRVRGDQSYYTVRINLAVYSLRHEAFRRESFSSPIYSTVLYTWTTCNNTCVETDRKKYATRSASRLPRSEASEIRNQKSFIFVLQPMAGLVQC